MTGQHRMPASVRRPPPPSRRPFRVVAWGAGVMFAAGTVAALGATVAPRVHVTAAREAVTASNALRGPAAVEVTQGDDAEPPVIATSAPRTAARVPVRVVLTRSVTPKPSEGVSAGSTTAAPTTTTAAPTTTAPTETTTTATTTTATETTTAEITTESTTPATTSDTSELPTDVLPTPTLP